MATDAFILDSKINIEVSKVINGLKQVDKEVDETGNKLENTEGKASKFSSIMGGMGKTLAGAFSLNVIKNFAQESIDGINTQILAETKLQNNLMATGKATQSNVNDLKEYASQLQKVGVIGDEVGMSGMSQLATFNLTSDSIKTLSDGMYNLAVNQKGVNVTSEDMLGYANLIGKAMQGNSTAMTRVGVTVTDAQKAIIENGNEMERASIIADILKANYGNLNEEIAKTPAGKGAQLANDWGDVKEIIGNTLLPMVAQLVQWLQKAVTWFGKLSPSMQKVVIVIAGIVAILPSLISMFSGIATIVGVMGISISGAILPILAIIIAIGAVIAIGVLLYKHWDDVKAKCAEVWDWIKAKFQAFNDWIGSIFATDWTKHFGIFGEVLNAYMANVKNIWDNVKKIFSGVIDFVKGVFTGDWKKAWEGVKQIFGGIFGVFESMVKAPLNGVIALVNMAIAGLNKINVKVPSWIPKIGGKKFGFDIPKIKYLYEGAIFTQPTMLGNNTVVGDKYNGQGSNTEAVMPVDKLRDMIKDLLQVAISLNIDGREFVQQVIAPHQDELLAYNDGR